MTIVDQLLIQLADLISQGRFVELETEGVEIKSVPADGNEWKKVYESVNAFLNTRGGVLIVGVKEEGAGSSRRYVFLNGIAYRRILTGDHKVADRDVEAQEEFKEEAAHAKELQPVAGMTERDLDLAKLNQFIFHLNQPQQIETLKPDLESALPFLERRCFIKDGAVTILGALVCGNHPGDRLGFRSHVHGYVDIPQQIAQDKQDFVDNVLQLMESSLGYLLRNIQIGISAKDGGAAVPQYPEEVLRETVNNALAHRDYSVNRQVILAIKPGVHIAIRNPGQFRRNLLIEDGAAEVPVRRILPEAKPRNPKLADVLRVYRKWEGRGIGMATLVNLCLENRIDLPYYHIFTEEVCL